MTKREFERFRIFIKKYPPLEFSWHCSVEMQSGMLYVVDSYESMKIQGEFFSFDKKHILRNEIRKINAWASPKEPYGYVKVKYF